MGKEKIGVAIVSDKSRVDLRPSLQEKIERSPHFEVVLSSREKLSRIRQEILRKNPNLVLVTVSLDHPEEFDELLGFVRKLRKHLPEAKIVVNTPWLPNSQRETIFEAGANGWIDEEIADVNLREELKKIAA